MAPRSTFVNLRGRSVACLVLNMQHSQYLICNTRYSSLNTWYPILRLLFKSGGSPAWYSICNTWYQGGEKIVKRPSLAPPGPGPGPGPEPGQLRSCKDLYFGRLPALPSLPWLPISSIFWIASTYRSYTASTWPSCLHCLYCSHYHSAQKTPIFMKSASKFPPPTYILNPGIPPRFLPIIRWMPILPLILHLIPKI